MQLAWYKPEYEKIPEMKHVIACDKESYVVFDDSQDPPQLIRRVKGAHCYDICKVVYSWHLSLVATASEGGEIAIWDYESSQLQSFLYAHD